jgi:superfamily II DNA/RNA helicase
VQADKLLSPEFMPVLEDLIGFCAPKRQILMFSATFPITVKEFKEKHVENPYEVNLMDELTLIGVTQYYAFVEERQKVHCLHTLFAKVRFTLRFRVRCCLSRLLTHPPSHPPSHARTHAITHSLTRWSTAVG